MNTRRGLRRLGAVGAALAFFLVMGAWKGLQYRDVLHVEYRGGEIESFYLDTGRDEDTGRDTVADCFTWDSGEPLVNTEACPDVLSGKVETFPPVPLQFPIGTLVWALIGLPLFFGVRWAIRGFGAGRISARTVACHSMGRAIWTLTTHRTCSACMCGHRRTKTC